MIFMGAHGARTRSLGSELEFIEEMGFFGDIASYFINACFASKRKTKTPAKQIEIPSSLELSCLDAEYSF